MNDTTNTLLPTSLVGSYSQPNWLIDRDKLGGRLPPRTRALELWRVDPEQLIEAQNDATLFAIREQEIAGLDIITDGETRRASYSNRFAAALDGVDLQNPGMAMDRTGKPNPVPRSTGPIRRKHPVEVEDVKFLRAHTDRRMTGTSVACEKLPPSNHGDKIITDLHALATKAEDLNSRNMSQAHQEAMATEMAKLTVTIESVCI